MVVRLSGVAKRDLDEIWLSLAKRNTGGAAVEGLSAKIVTLSDHPFLSSVAWLKPRLI